MSSFLTTMTLRTWAVRAFLQLLRSETSSLNRTISTRTLRVKDQAVAAAKAAAGAKETVLHPAMGPVQELTLALSKGRLATRTTKTSRFPPWRERMPLLVFLEG